MSMPCGELPFIATSSIHAVSCAPAASPATVQRLKQDNRELREAVRSWQVRVAVAMARCVADVHSLFGPVGVHSRGVIAWRMLGA